MTSPAAATSAFAPSSIVCATNSIRRPGLIFLATIEKMNETGAALSGRIGIIVFRLLFPFYWTGSQGSQIRPARHHLLFAEGFASDVAVYDSAVLEILFGEEMSSCLQLRLRMPLRRRLL